MSARYEQKIGRLGIRYDNTGGMCDVTIKCLAGWNEACETNENVLSLEELRDLQYLISRVLAAAELTH